MIYDWIVIGAGLTGSAVSYELAKKGFAVLLLDPNLNIHNATRYSYGGIPYWAANTNLTKKIFNEGIKKHRNLSAELNADTEFREIDILLTIDSEQNPDNVLLEMSQFAIKPQFLSTENACKLEPLLNPHAINGVVKFPHGHVNPKAIVTAYQQAFLQEDGIIEIGKVTGLIRKKTRFTGVITANQETYQSDNILVCTGGLTRELLQQFGIKCKIYFTHAEMIEILPSNIKLNTLVVPAKMTRMKLETELSNKEVEYIWDSPDHQLVSDILEPGAIQFLDGSMRIGQISRFITDPHAEIYGKSSEDEMRNAIRQILPNLADLPGTWHQCLVAFSHDHLPLIGKFADIEGLQIFSGFSSPFIYVPILAERFANFATGAKDDIINKLSPARFTK